MKKLLDSKWFIMLIVLPFMEPRGIVDMALYKGGVWTRIDLIFGVLKVISFVCVAGFSFYELRKVSSIVFYIVLFEGIILFSTFINKDMNGGSVANVVSILGICILTDYYIRSRNTVNFMAVIATILGIYILINLFSMLIYPEGIYVDNRGWETNYFLGYRNLHIYVYLPFMLVYAMYQYARYRKVTFSFYGMCIVILISAAVSNSITTLLAITLITILIYLFGRFPVLKHVNIFMVYLFSFLLSLAMVFFNVQNIFSNFIVGILGKTTTLSDRNRIWLVCLAMIRKQPILGYGSFSLGNVLSYMDITQAHNQYIDIFLRGGIVLFICFSVLMFKLSRNLSQVKDTQLHNILLITWIGYFILFLTESRPDDVYMWMLVTITFYIEEIVSRYNPLVGYQRKSIKLKMGL